MRTLALMAFSLCLLCASLSACGMSWIAEPKTNPVIEDRVGLFGRQPVGTLATTAERRIVLVRIAENDPKLGQFCAEPPPDAAENIANKLALAVEATVKTPEAEGSGRLELAKQLATSVQSLFHRSQGLQFYRDSMYNLCQSYLNGALDPNQFIERSGVLLDKSHELILKELVLTQGIIGGPPPAPPSILQLDDTGLPSGRLRLLQSDRVRAFKLVTDLDNAKREKSETKAKVALVELHDILVTNNAKLPSDSPKRTMGDDELKSVLDRLRPLAIEASQDKLVLPAQLKDISTREDFQNMFIPFPS
jgi:hypothetical protein